MAQPKALLTVSQQTLEKWINDSIENGRSANLIGLVDEKTFERGKGQLEDFRIKIENDAELADRVGQKEADKMQAFREAEHVSKIGQPEPKEAHVENDDDMAKLFASLFGDTEDEEEEQAADRN